MKNNEETWGTFHITVNKIGRKWVHVTIPRSNGYKLEATVDKSSIADCKIDDEMDISGCLQREFIVKAMENASSDDLKNIVEECNSDPTVIDPEEYLSDSVYYYDAKKHVLRRHSNERRKK